MWSESIKILNPYEAIQTKLFVKRQKKKIDGREKRAVKLRNIKWLHDFLYNRGYYKIDDLQGWGHCGICGKFMPNAVMEKDWAWGICKECKSETR